jgi:hypothetical protein
MLYIFNSGNIYFCLLFLSCMDFLKDGEFYVPKNVDVIEYGDKARLLFTEQDSLLRHGFALPTSAVLPWNFFEPYVQKSKISYKRELIQGKNRPFCDISVGHYFDSVVDNLLFDIKAKIGIPFFSSSAKGEDSLLTRMAGVYHSKFVDFKLKDTQAHYSYAASDALSEVVNSYYNLLPTLLREKHGIPHEGMSVLARPIIGGEEGPQASIVYQHIAKDLAQVAITWGFGENIVTRNSGQEFQYDLQKECLLDCHGQDVGVELKEWHESRFADYFPAGFDGLRQIISQIRTYDESRRLPDGVGGDYELSLQDDMWYMLQVSQIPQMQSQQIQTRGNILSRVDQVAGCGTKSIEKIVFVPEFESDDDEVAHDLFAFNSQNKDYLIVTEGMSQNAGLFCNAAGILETFYVDPTNSTRKFRASGRMHREDNNVVAHYATLLRSEQIGVVEAKYDSWFDTVKSGALEVGKLKVLTRPITFVFDQLEKKAGLFVV